MLKKLKQIFKNKGVTLVEVLVATSLFAIATFVAGDILISDVQLEKKTNLQNTLASEIRIVLQQITSEIQNGTIDYDEYYSICVLQNGCKYGFPSDSVLYGVYNGVYGSRFYNPGKSLSGLPTENPKDLGSECSFPKPLNGKDCEAIYNLSVDLNTGQNPFRGAADDANAFCDKNTQGDACDQIVGSSVTVDQLFIIDKTGTKKTIIAKKLIRNLPGVDYALGKVVMNGKDYDQNGIVDIFSCADGYNCYGAADDSQATALANLIPFTSITGKVSSFIKNNKISIPKGEDLKKPFEGNAKDSTFVPITPLFANVEDVKFIIHPLEDPYRAYAEPNMKGQPSVTIMLKIGLSSVAAKDYPGIFPSLMVQTTVAAGVTQKIETYPPITEIKDVNTDNWLIKMLEQPLNLYSVSN